MKSQARKVLLATLSAFGLALVLLFIVILPAEYGWDPTGVGDQLGLTGFSQSRPESLQVSDVDPSGDRIEFMLAPFESVEYKYRMLAGDTLVYTWQSQAEVVYDMHAEPKGAVEGYADSFGKGRAKSSAGSYRAAYDGIHGWFWQNRGNSEVTLVLETQGFYTGAIEFRDGREFDYDF